MTVVKRVPIIRAEYEGHDQVDRFGADGPQQDLQIDSVELTDNLVKQGRVTLVFRGASDDHPYCFWFELKVKGAQDLAVGLNAIAPIAKHQYTDAA